MTERLEPVGITVNGQARRTAASRLVELLGELGFGADRRGVAVAVNGNVVARSAWESTPLDAGDAIEIVGAVQGG